jgi:signal transduction histidine kinase
MSSTPISFVRRMWSALRGGSGLEARLVLLGLIGASVCLSLVATLIFVQRSLERSQRQLAELAVPAEARIAQIESSLDAAFRRQGRIADARSTEELEQLRDRHSVEEEMREAAHASLVAAASGGAAVPDLSAHVERFLVADTAFFGAIERKHALDTDFNKKLGEVDAGVAALVASSRSLAGVLRLDYTLQLRTIAESLQRGTVRVDVVRASTFGTGRQAREAAVRLVEALMDLGWRIDAVRDQSIDGLASMTANVLPQSRANLETIFQQLHKSLDTDPVLRTRVDAIGAQFRDLLPQLANGIDGRGLISLRRGVLEEQARAASIRVETEAAAQQLTSDSERLRAEVAGFADRSIREAGATRKSTRVFSILLAVVGLLSCLLAGRRIAQGIDELKIRNRSLTDLKESLTALNASLDTRVAERTCELSEANGRLKHEIVEREKMELELRLAQKLEGLGRLAAGVAHEINTPVQFVSDSIHFVQDSIGELGPLLVKYRQLESAVAAGTATSADAAELSEARESADLDYMLENLPTALSRSLDGLGRVAAIVKSMKAFAHPDQKEMTEVDLNRAIETTLTIARSEYKLIADVETVLGEIPLVRCHAGEVNQVLLNIIVNAAHAIGDVVRGTEKKGLIRIGTERQSDSVAISISDSGGGIPLAIRDRIFDPFFTTKEVGKGTGQGLAIARSVIQEKHGGTLGFESELGKGTTFTIRLAIDGSRSSAQPGLAPASLDLLPALSPAA